MILCVGGTPAVQRTLFLDRLETGGVNRARKTRVTAAGKALNAARTVALLGARPFLVTFLGGDPGRFVARELDRASVPHEAVWTADDAPTRTCTTLLHDDGGVTELVEEAPPISKVDAAALEDAALRRLGDTRALCLTGSMPPGVPEDLYTTLVRAAKNASIPVLVDAQKALLRNALAERPFLVKPNLQEAAATLDLAVKDDENGAESAVTALLEAGAQWALVTRGKAGAMLGDGTGQRWRVEPPRIDAINPIGSGDVMAGGLLLALVGGASVPDASRYGTACAAAGTLSPVSGGLRPGDVDKLLRETRLVRTA